MAITIQGPDGASIDFPDGTPEPEISAAMAQAYPGEKQDPGFVANAVRALASGANPFQDRMVAAEKTLLPQSMGGSPGFDYGANLEAERAANQQLREQHPNLSNFAQGTGAALSSLAVPAAALGRAAQGTNLAGRLALGGAAGEGVGAVQGLGASPDLTNPAQTAESTLSGGNMGGALGVAFPAAASGVGKVVNPLAAALARGPGKADIASLGNEVSAAYKNVENLGASYSPEAYQRLVSKIAADADSARINPGLHPGSSGVISDMQKAAARGEPIDLPRLDQDRQIAWRDAAGKPDAGERQFGGLIRKNIDEFISGAKSEDMASGGSPSEAADAIGNARDLAMRQFKAQALTGALDKAEVRAAVSGTGGNVENTTRQRLSSIMDKEPWSPDERAQLERMIKGTPTTNTIRQLSRFGPTGNALMMALEVGAMGSGHLPLMAMGAGGMAAQGAEALMRRSAKNNLLATILAGGQSPKALALAPPDTSRAMLAATLAANRQLSQRKENSLP